MLHRLAPKGGHMDEIEFPNNFKTYHTADRHIYASMNNANVTDDHSDDHDDERGYNIIVDVKVDDDIEETNSSYDNSPDVDVNDNHNDDEYHDVIKTPNGNNDTDDNSASGDDVDHNCQHHCDDTNVNSAYTDILTHSALGQLTMIKKHSIGSNGDLEDDTNAERGNEIVIKQACLHHADYVAAAKIQNDNGGHTYAIHTGDDVRVYREQTKRWDGPSEVAWVSQKTISLTHEENVNPFNITAILPMEPTENDTDQKQDMNQVYQYSITSQEKIQLPSQILYK